MNTLIEQIKQQPNMMTLVNELNQIVEEENKRREEFYNTITEEDKAEFINGEVIMHSPAKRRHGKPLVYLISLLNAYATKYDAGEIYTEKAMIHLTRNSYEPDIAFFKTEKALSLTDDQMLFPAPDLIVEVTSPSTEKYDRGIKFTDYALHGVQEYWIVDPVIHSVEQYLLKENNYYLEFKGKTGTITSSALIGFTIEINAIFNKEKFNDTLRQILSS